MLSEGEQAKYEAKAKEKREAFFAEVQIQIESLREPEKVKTKGLTDFHRGIDMSPTLLSSHRLTPGELEELERMYQDPQWGERPVMRMRSEPPCRSRQTIVAFPGPQPTSC